MFLVNLVQKVRLYYFFVYLGFIYQIQSIDILSRYLCFNVEMLFSLNCRWFLHDDDATNNLLRLPSVPLVFGTWSVHAHCTRVWLISDNAVPLTLRYSLLYVLIKYLILGPVLFFFSFFSEFVTHSNTARCTTVAFNKPLLALLSPLHQLLR